MKLLNFIIIAGFFMLSGCSSSPKNPIMAIRVGMDKDTVLEKLGSPQRSDRKHGADRWTYIHLADKGQSKPDVTEIYFQNGKVSYVGTPKENPREKVVSAATPPKGTSIESSEVDTSSSESFKNLD